MRIITLSCPKCGTVVAGNVLEDNRVMKCPGLGCETEHRFEDLSESDRQYILENIEQFEIS